MADEAQADSQDAGNDSEVSVEEKQAQQEIAKALEGETEVSPERTDDSKKGEEVDGPEAPKLTKKQESAVKAIGWTAKEVLAMGDKGIAFANRMVKQRDDLSRHAGKADHLQKQFDKLQAELAKVKPESKADPKVGEISEDDDLEERSRDKINENFRTLQKQLDETREELAALKSGGSEEEVDSRGERDRDEYFESLKGDWPQFGEGPLSELVEGSPEVLARDELLEEAIDKMKKADKQGRSLSFEDACDSALASLYTQEYKNVAIRRAKKKSKDKVRGSVEPPAGRTHKPVKDVEAEVVADLQKGLAADPL